MSVVAAGLLLGSVIATAVGSLLGLRMWLAHSAKSFEHKPLAEMQAKLDELEARLSTFVMRR